MRQAEDRECQEQIRKKIIMPRHGILLQIIFHSTSVPIHQNHKRKRQAGKKAVLQYRVISVTPDRDGSQNECIRTEFDIKLLTGRHHQIRLQLAHIGYPLIGDTKYRKPASNNSGMGSKSGRTGGGVREQLALCSYKLVFDHPATGERMTFELP